MRENQLYHVAHTQHGNIKQDAFCCCSFYHCILKKNYVLFPFLIGNSVAQVEEKLLSDQEVASSISTMNESVTNLEEVG